jgi:hypothetical protein
MEWALTWFWILAAAKWCFYAFLAYFTIKWWMRSYSDSTRLRFVESKIDVLMEHLETGFHERFREHIADVLHDKGENAAVKEYALSTGNSLAEAEQFVDELSRHGENFNAESPERLLTDLDVDELHKLVDETFQPSPHLPRKSRRTSRRRR